jgi:hypothetical protein
VADIRWPTQDEVGRYGDATGIYERLGRSGWVERVALTNGQKHVSYSYYYPMAVRQEREGDLTQRHSDNNLMLCGGYGWRGPGHRLLNIDLAILEQLLENRKPAGQMTWIQGPYTPDAEKTEQEAARLLVQAGFEVIRSGPEPWNRQTRYEILAAPPRIGVAEEIDQVVQEWRRVSGDESAQRVERALLSTSGWGVEEFRQHFDRQIKDDIGADPLAQLATTGYVLGYPPITTASVLGICRTEPTAETKRRP